MLDSNNYFFTNIIRQIENCPIILTYSSPHLKRAYFSYAKDRPTIEEEFDALVSQLSMSTDHPAEENADISLHSLCDKVPMTSGHNHLHSAPPSGSCHEILPEKQNEENMEFNMRDAHSSAGSPAFHSHKEFKKKQKHERREQKVFDKARKDAHKRGYDTSLLYQLKDPERIYELSDEEINQIQASEYINKDGFYDFVFPPDAKTFKKRELISKRRVLFIGILIILAVLFAGILVNNIFSLF